MNQPDPSRRLADETSPYLRQHADNPVDWHPWGPEALEKARSQDKPILLSVGYSACHWCHVMAHESFEDPATARVMNELFVNIKVDREERPDIDRIYQTAHQLLTQRPGGWPLTMFLTPGDQMPFFGGTYFPPQPRHAMPAFVDLLERVAGFYRGNAEEIRQQGVAMRDAFSQMNPATRTAGSLTDAPLDGGRRILASGFDADHGGFGPAPKFPNAGGIDLMMRRWYASAHDPAPDTEALFMAAQTLRRMALGGLFDQLGGGFFRYSVDERWEIPHFEKMLYDNALLLPVYADMWRASGDEFYRRIARETAAWVLRDMRSPDGAFYSSLDADSEGEEGRYYLWTPDEIRSLVDDDQYEVLHRRYGLSGDANFEGRRHLNVRADIESIAAALDRTAGEVTRRLDGGRQGLLETRSKRVAPGRDDKILTSWNALMIRALAISGRQLDDPMLVAAAERAVDFIRETLWDGRRLKATAKDRDARLDAYLDDYAFLLDALIELLGCRWRSADLDFAVALADTLLDAFADSTSGGFFFTAHDHETLLTRLKPLADEATPSGNGVAAVALQRLGYLLGETRYLDAADATLRAAWDVMSRYPQAHTSLLTALSEHLAPPSVVVLRGRLDSLDLWRDAIGAIYAPGRLVFCVPSNAHGLPDAIATKAPRGDAVAYVCQGMTCSAPLDSLEELARALTSRATDTATGT